MADETLAGTCSNCNGYLGLPDVSGTGLCHLCIGTKERGLAAQIPTTEADSIAANEAQSEAANAPLEDGAEAPMNQEERADAAREKLGLDEQTDAAEAGSAGLTDEEQAANEKAAKATAKKSAKAQS